MNTNSLPSYLELLGKTFKDRLTQQQPVSDTLPTVFPHGSLPQDTHFSDLLNHPVNESELLILLLGLYPHLKPHLFDHILMECFPQGGELPEIGGIRGKQHRGFLPTGETALFLLAGETLDKRVEIQRLFDPTYWLIQRGIIYLEPALPGEPRMSGRLIMHQEYVELFTTGNILSPELGIDFPAERIQTLMDWEDLVLPQDTLKQIRELEQWIQHGRTLLDSWKMRKFLKPGYRALFYGPPGTGKTLTASLLGKSTGKSVYRVDLSIVVSKFIGETEKNLANLFKKAESKDWMLFFDEADALFGKRTGVRDAHDKYANQEVAYLLQRVENYDGLVILASNLRSNIDEAFIRRFQSIIHFPMPKAPERLRLWKNLLPEAVSLDTKVNLEDISRRHELSGASILNVIQYVCLELLAKQAKTMDMSLLNKGIDREYKKEGKR